MVWPMAFARLGHFPAVEKDETMSKLTLRCIATASNFRLMLNQCIVVIVTAGLVCNCTSQLFSQANSGSKFPSTVRKEVGTKWKVKGKVTASNLRPLSGVKVYLTRGIIYHPMTANRHFNISEPGHGLWREF